MAITERFFAANYFDQYLSGAQADQEVLGHLMKDKLPMLAAHLDSLDIEISTVTLNWFLAIFFDALPFEVSHFLFYTFISMDKSKTVVSLVIKHWRYDNLTLSHWFCLYAFSVLYTILIGCCIS